PYARLQFGELDGEATARAEGLLGAARAAGIDAELSTDIVKDIWTKFVFICGMSGVCTLTRSPVGPVVAAPETRSLLADCMHEVAAVAAVRGIRLDPDLVDRNMASTSGMNPAGKPSMLYDLEHENPLEVAWLNGTVAQLGAELGVSTPVNRVIAAALRLRAGSPGSPA